MLGLAQEGIAWHAMAKILLAESLVGNAWLHTLSETAKREGYLTLGGSLHERLCLSVKECMMGHGP